MVCCIWALLECVSRLWEIWKYMYFSQEFEVFEICEEFFSMVLGLWTIGVGPEVGMWALSQDMMSLSCFFFFFFLSCLNYCIPGRVPSGSDGKESASNTGLIPGSRRSPGEGNGHPLQCSCLENPHGQRSLVGDSPWGHKESDTTEWLKLSLSHWVCFTVWCLGGGSISVPQRLRSLSFFEMFDIGTRIMNCFLVRVQEMSSFSCLRIWAVWRVWGIWVLLGVCSMP